MRVPGAGRLMRNPNLDRRITIQSSTETPDSRGTPVATWADTIPDLPAEYLPSGGREQFAGDRHPSIAHVQFRIRYRADIVPSMRIIHDGAIHNISHAEEDRRFLRRQYLLITTQALPVD
jgi:SPP1 family predicted phage head-tail adaptor